MNAFSFFNIGIMALRDGESVPETSKESVNDSVSKVLSYFTSTRFIFSIVIVIIAILICIGISRATKILTRRLGKDVLDSGKKTVVHIITSIVKGIIIVVALICMLQVNGIQVSGLLTSVSILSAIIGLALQDAIKDMIQGMHIVSDKYFIVGDVIEYKGIYGEVVKISLRSIKIKDVANANIMTISNRNISEITKVGNLFYIHVNLSYDEDVNKVFAVLKEAAERISKLERIEASRFRGTQAFNDSSIDYLIEITCDPKHYKQSLRDANRVIQDVLDENNIVIPYNQLDVHQID